MLNALLWAKRQIGEEPFVAILYDSMYAHNITRGIWRPKTNKDIASLCKSDYYTVQYGTAVDICVLGYMLQLYSSSYY